MLRTEVISSIFNGQQPSFYFGAPGEFLSSIGIDPDMPATDSATDVKTAGIIRPVNYEKFSGSNVTSYPIAIITNPKNTLTYVILANGRIISYTAAQGSETLVGTCAGGSARGAWYQNNYIYITGTGSSHDDVSRYGPLNNSPTLVDNVWKGVVLGSQAALTDTTYPSTLLSIPYLNHSGFVHVDNKGYFTDYAAGVGYLHFIKTKKTTDEGDTNDGSTYGALDLPLNTFPTCASSYGTGIAVAGTPTTSSTAVQGNAMLFFWDTVADSFDRALPLPGVICTALWYENGTLYGIVGDPAGGYRLFRYIGGDSVETLHIIEDGHAPLQGAKDAIGNRLVWASDTTYPLTASGLLAHGSKSDLFPRGLHHIALSAFN